MGAHKTFELILEFGHKSQPLPKTYPHQSHQSPKATHKWMTFVRGVGDTKIEHCIDRVVFNLHQDFANPCREVTKPPYQVTEIGYAGFVFPVEIYFKNRELPNHVVFEYDLHLMIGQNHDAKRLEKIKFINPNKDFERCLMKAGADLISVPKRSPNMIEDDLSKKLDRPPQKKQKPSSLVPTKDMYNKHHHTSASNQHNSHPHLIHHSSSQPSSFLHHNHNHQQQSHNSLPRDTHNNNRPKDSFDEFFGSQLITTTTKSQTRLTPPILPQISIKKDKKHHRIETIVSPEVKEAYDEKKKSKKKSKDKDHDKTKSKSKNKHKDKDKDKDENKSKNKHKDKDKEKDKERTRDSIKEIVKEKVPSKDAVIDRYKNKESEGDANTLVSYSNSITNNIPSNYKQSNLSYFSDLALIQSKLANLSDCDRLQKVVDIIDQSGEWYNITDKKFEIDLERLDKKTLEKIEKFLYI